VNFAKLAHMTQPTPAEHWLPVPSYEDLYEVSDQGRVRPVRRILKPQRNTKGYQAVTLSKNGHTKTFAIHTLVMAAFEGPCPPGQQVRHGPRGQGDNWYDNLSYGTPPQNQADRVRDGTTNRGERSANAKLTEAIVAECRRRYAAGETQSALAREFGVSSGAMSMAIRGKRWAYAASQPVISGKPSQQTAEFRAQMSEKGRRGADARWNKTE
jgi:NUMOD4 motif